MFKKLFDLTGKTALVIGGTGILGSKFCEGLAEFGANVVIADIEKSKIYALAKKINKNYSVTTLPLFMDVTNKKSVNQEIETVLKKFKRIDVLVNSAYPRNKDYGKKFEDTKLESWQENIDMNLGGTFLVTQIVAKQMMRQKAGSIINLGSIYGLVGPDFSIYKGTEWTNPSEYSVIKGGIISFTRYLATYLAPYNIRVNCISPGGIYEKDSKLFLRRYSKRTPLGRKAKAEEIVGGLIYLASDASSYVTGHNLVIDGGWTISS